MLNIVFIIYQLHNHGTGTNIIIIIKNKNCKETTPKNCTKQTIQTTINGCQKKKKKLNKIAQVFLQYPLS